MFAVLTPARALAVGQRTVFKQFLPGVRDEVARQVVVNPGLDAFFGELGALDALDMFEEVSFSSPTSISALVTFDELYAVSEKEYTFEVKFTLILAWYDEQIFRNCPGVHPWQEPLQCPEVWRPKVVLANAKAVEGGVLEPIEGSEIFVAYPRGWEKHFGECLGSFSRNHAVAAVSTLLLTTTPEL